MSRDAAIFWIVVLVLVAASMFYGVNVEKQRRQLNHAGAELETGDVVRLERVVDGDTVVVAKEGAGSATVRILGIKTFNAKVEKDSASRFGQAAVERVQRLMSTHPVRVMLHSPPMDEHGRYLAILYVKDRDLGLELVKEGVALVYSVHPFPAMPIYLQEQELARARNRGFWGDSEVKRRALALIAGWQEQQQ